MMEIVKDIFYFYLTVWAWIGLTAGLATLIAVPGFLLMHLIPSEQKLRENYERYNGLGKYKK